MKPLALYIMLLLAVMRLGAVVPSHLGSERLTYKVMYKWGMINKQAGTAVLTIKPEGDTYATKLTAKSDPWADKFFTVRDTLTGIVYRNGFKPLRYTNISHEGGDYKHDQVIYDRSNPSITRAKCLHYKLKKNATEPRRQEQSLEATGVALDMLSMYYYMRYIDYPALGVGGREVLTVFSGRRKETLTIKYEGEDNVKVDNKTWHCHRITFTFTSDGGKKTSDDMTAWISTDSRHIPVKLEGKLPVGKVHCLYTGS